MCDRIIKLFLGILKIVILDEIKGTRMSWKVHTILFVFGLKERIFWS